MRKKEKKIVIFGKGEVGKSTLIKGLIKNSINIAHQGRTTALDFGILMHNSRKYHFYGTPGQHRFSMVREVLSLGVDGVIFVLDGLQGIDEKDRQIFKEVEALGVAYLIVINLRENREGKVSAAELDHCFCKNRSLFRGAVRGSVLDPVRQKEILEKLEEMTANLPHV